MYICVKIILTTKDVVEILPKFIMIKIQKPDDETVLEQIDQTLPVASLKKMIADKYCIPHWRDYGWKVSSRWLEEKQSLHAQAVSEESEIVLAPRFVEDPNLDVLYQGCVGDVYRGRFVPVPLEKEATLLAALQAQIEHGSWNHKFDTRFFRQYLPIAYFHIFSRLDDEIENEYKKLGNLSSNHAKNRYVMMVTSEPQLNFLVNYKESSEDFLSSKMLIITPGSILLVNNRLQIVKKFQITELESCELEDEMKMTLHFQGNHPVSLQTTSPASEIQVQLLNALLGINDSQEPNKSAPMLEQASCFIR